MRNCSLRGKEYNIYHNIEFINYKIYRRVENIKAKLRKFLDY